MLSLCKHVVPSDEYTVKLQKAIMYTIYLLSQNIKQLQSLRIRHHPGAI
jgi:hypothetical protein